MYTEDDMDYQWDRWENSHVPPYLMFVADALWDQWSPGIGAVVNPEDISPLAKLDEFPRLFIPCPERLIDFALTEEGRIVWLRLVRLAYADGKFIDLAYNEKDEPWIVAVSLASRFFSL